MNACTTLMIFISTLTLLGCARTKVGSTGDVIEITPVTIDSSVTMVTNDDVTLRTYTFKDIPLQFVFQDSSASYITYGNNYRKDVSGSFYTLAMIKKGSKLLHNYDCDTTFFNNDQCRNHLILAQVINYGTRRYVLCVFDREQFSVGSLEPYLAFLLDISNPNAISTVSFINRQMEGEELSGVFSHNGHLCISVRYYLPKHKKHETATAIITQNNLNEWVVE